MPTHLGLHSSKLNWTELNGCGLSVVQTHRIASQGYVILCSGKSKQWICDMKLNGSVRSAAFSPDSTEASSSSSSIVYRLCVCPCCCMLHVPWCECIFKMLQLQIHMRTTCQYLARWFRLVGRWVLLDHRPRACPCVGAVVHYWGRRRDVPLVPSNLSASPVQSSSVQSLLACPNNHAANRCSLKCVIIRPASSLLSF